MDAAKSYDIPKFKEQYENFIGGEWVAPVGGKYFIFAGVNEKCRNRMTIRTAF